MDELRMPSLWWKGISHTCGAAAAAATALVAAAAVVAVVLLVLVRVWGQARVRRRSVARLAAGVGWLAAGAGWATPPHAGPVRAAPVLCAWMRIYMRAHRYPVSLVCHCDRAGGAAAMAAVAGAVACPACPSLLPACHPLPKENALAMQWPRTGHTIATMASQWQRNGSAATSHGERRGSTMTAQGPCNDRARAAQGEQGQRKGIIMAAQ